MHNTHNVHHIRMRIKCHFLFISFVWVELVCCCFPSAYNIFEHVIVMLQFALLANCISCVYSGKWHKKLNRELFDIGVLCVVCVYHFAFCQGFCAK